MGSAVEADGVEILDRTFSSLAIAESFFHDDVIDLGSDFGPSIDLTFGYTLVADGSGGFGFDLAIGGAVPESSTWAIDAGRLRGALAYAGYRSTRGTSARLHRPSGLASGSLHKVSVTFLRWGGWSGSRPRWRAVDSAAR